MVREISPLVIFLRYLAHFGDWIIIDEPEISLHPEAQAKFIEFLAILINKGLHILITTHSPYFVDHLINLMKAYKAKNQKKIRKKFFLQNIDAFISPEKVSAYFFNNGIAVNIFQKKNGLIDWGTFGNISDKISNLFFEL